MKKVLYPALLLAITIGIGLTVWRVYGVKPEPKIDHAGAGAAAASKACAEAHGNPSLFCAKAPTASFDSKGRLWLAWDQTDRVYVNYSDDLGKSFSIPVAVNSVPEPVEATGEARPKIAISKDGVVYVAWTKRLGKPHTGHIRFSRSLDGGKTFTDPVQIDGDTQEIGHRFESMAINEQGDIFLAWIDKRDKAVIEKSGGQYVGGALYFTVSEDGGRSFHLEKKIVDHVCECCRLSLKIAANQLPAVFWRHVFDGQIRDHALIRFNAKDQPGPIQKIGNDHWRIDGCPHHGPAISISPQGNFYTTWFTDGDVRKGLFFSASLDQGKNFSEPLGFGNTPLAVHPDILADEKAVYLVWKESEGKIKSTLFEKHSSDGGTTWTAPKPVAESQGESDHPFLLAFRDQHYAAWQSKDQGFRLISLGD